MTKRAEREVETETARETDRVSERGGPFLFDTKFLFDDIFPLHSLHFTLQWQLNRIFFYEIFLCIFFLPLILNSSLAIPNGLNFDAPIISIAHLHDFLPIISLFFPCSNLKNEHCRCLLWPMSPWVAVHLPRWWFSEPFSNRANGKMQMYYLHCLRSGRVELSLYLLFGFIKTRKKAHNGGRFYQKELSRTISKLCF